MIMFHSQSHFDWRDLADHTDDDPVVCTRHRLRWVLGLFAVGLAIIGSRAVQLEISDGENFRRLAAEMPQRIVELPAPRGRILARDGTVLAQDRETRALAVHYRYLQSTPERAWLRRLARSRLSRADRQDLAKVEAMQQRVRAELAELRHRLAQLCQWTDQQWQTRAARIEQRVSQVAATVNARTLARYEQRTTDEATSSELSAAAIVIGLFAPPDALPPPPIVVEEEASYHRIADDVSTEVAGEIESHPERYPGVKIVTCDKRDYPQGTLAAHLVGHVTGGTMAETTIRRDQRPLAATVGLMGAERRFDATLQGRPGLEMQTTDHRGTLLNRESRRAPSPGHDVVLSIDPALQSTAEQLLDHAIERLQNTEPADSQQRGGAIVVMDVDSGELIAVASAPRFDPRAFAAGDVEVAAVLNDPSRPLFDRATKMALPPGSVFKSITALALFQADGFDPRAAFHCQGYLNDADRMRCQIFRQHGVGHGDVTLADALAQSCNVYFFHHIAEQGAVPLADWAGRLGFGQVTGVELDDEAAGQVPTAAQLRELEQACGFSIGQGAFTATPLQLVRAYAAIANGGYLLTPRLTRDEIDAHASGRKRRTVQRSDTARIEGLTNETLAAVREGLFRTVNDPNGSAYATARITWPVIAGKTGTAQVGGAHQDHAWFAGYAPADEPRYALVIVLEHAGSGAANASVLAKDLIQRMRQLGYFGAPQTATARVPPGKG
jgi:penicillin-binding protein 2